MAAFFTTSTPSLPSSVSLALRLVGEGRPDPSTQSFRKVWSSEVPFETIWADFSPVLIGRSLTNTTVISFGPAESSPDSLFFGASLEQGDGHRNGLLFRFVDEAVRAGESLNAVFLEVTPSTVRDLLDDNPVTVRGDVGLVSLEGAARAPIRSADEMQVRIQFALSNYTRANCLVVQTVGASSGRKVSFVLLPFVESGSGSAQLSEHLFAKVLAPVAEASRSPTTAMVAARSKKKAAVAATPTVFIPYRSSMLTRLLMDSLGERGSKVMVVVGLASGGGLQLEANRATLALAEKISPGAGTGTSRSAGAAEASAAPPPTHLTLGPVSDEAAALLSLEKVATGPGLSHLRELQMAQCSLRSAPTALLHLSATSNLEVLNLSSNSIPSLPSLPPSLTSLDVSSNPLVSLGPLPLSLKVLRAANTLLLRSADEVPANLPELVAEGLEVLDLTGCPVHEAALKAVGALVIANPSSSTLRELRIAGPPVLAEASGTVSLKFLREWVARSSFAYESLPLESIFASVDLDGNGTLDTAEMLKLNEALMSGTAAASRKGFAPTWPFALPRLAVLDLSNTLTSAVEGMHQSPSLEVVLLDNCPRLLMITRVPATLQTLGLSGASNLKTPPPEVVKSNSSISYIRSLSAGSAQCFRIKMCMVGIGAAGKTSLLSRLRGQGFDAESSSTDGITMLPWEVDHPAEPGKRVEFSCMDFAGQPVYLNTHPLFISPRSLFVLCWNVRLGWGSSGVEAWLNSIASRAPGAPVLVVGTHVDQVPMGAEVPTEDIMARFGGQVKGFFAVSSKTGEGLGELAAAVIAHATAEAYMGELVPVPWLNLEHQLQELSKREARKLASLDEVLAVARLQCAISDPLEATRALEFLSDLSSICFFSRVEELKDLVILDPQWLMDTLSLLVSAQNTVPGLNQGSFAHSQLPLIWPGCDSTLLRHILKITEVFDLTLPVFGNQQRSVVPCLLPENPPASASVSESGVTGFREILLPFFPYGILSRLIVRLQAYLPGAKTGQGDGDGDGDGSPLLLWKSGAVLGVMGHTVWLRFGAEGRRLRVAASGSYSRAALDVVQQTLENLLAEAYPGLLATMDTLVPCGECLAAAVTKPAVFSVKDARRASALGVPFLQCHRHFHMVPTSKAIASVPARDGAELALSMVGEVSAVDNLALELRQEARGAVFPVFPLYAWSNSARAVRAGEATAGVAPAEQQTVDPRDVIDKLVGMGFETARDWLGKGLSSDASRSIASASVVLAFVSTDMCRDGRLVSLFTFAVSLSRAPQGPKIIPVIVGPSGDSAWARTEVGMLISGLLYVDLRSSFAEKLAELAGRLRGALPVAASSPSATTTTTSNNPPPPLRPYHVFISYAWGNSAEAVGADKASGRADPRRVKALLEDSGVPCWLDVERLGGAGLFEDISKGLRGTTLMLIFASDQYSRSANCMMELRFGVKVLQLPAAVVFVGEEFDHKTEAGLILASIRDRWEGGEVAEVVSMVKRRLAELLPPPAAPGSTKADPDDRISHLASLLEHSRRSFLARVAAADIALKLAPASWPRVWTASLSGFLSPVCENPSNFHLPAGTDNDGFIALDGSADDASSDPQRAVLAAMSVYLNPLVRLMAFERGQEIEELASQCLGVHRGSAEALFGMSRHVLLELTASSSSSSKQQQPTGLARHKLPSGDYLWLCKNCAESLRGVPLPVSFQRPQDPAPTKVFETILNEIDSIELQEAPTELSIKAKTELPIEPPTEPPPKVQQQPDENKGPSIVAPRATQTFETRATQITPRPTTTTTTTTTTSSTPHETKKAGSKSCTLQ